ncbi:hypothetical protein CHS0354_033069 [Potamilus streckersoni]|uniref:Uncharacterized protein n=1 Tax=Potamilus streckersoni TaxID=2493646 RepID=A0AAE0WA52_9BIVA|nr:hypothetical protein CHS0354_033069 [Potamilus streckersoni]
MIIKGLRGCMFLDELRLEVECMCLDELRLEVEYMCLDELRLEVECMCLDELRLEIEIDAKALKGLIGNLKTTIEGVVISEHESLTVFRNCYWIDMDLQTYS